MNSPDDDDLAFWQGQARAERDRLSKAPPGLEGLDARRAWVELGAAFVKNTPDALRAAVIAARRVLT